MNRWIVFLFGLFILPVLGVTQEQSSSEYQLINNIPYKKGNELSDYEKERCVLDIYYPTSKDSFTTIIWFHGGGIMGGEKFIPEQLMEKEVAIVAANYRLHPKVKCPEYIEDAAAAVAWVFNHISEYGGDPDKIVVSGHSAGGYLASMVGLDTGYLEEHQIDANRIAALIPFSGHAVTHFTIRKEMGIPGTQVIADKYAPIYHVRPDAPPYIIITGDRDLELLGRYEENAYMWRMMQEAGHDQTEMYELEGYNHGEMAVPAFHILMKSVHHLINKK